MIIHHESEEGSVADVSIFLKGETNAPFNSFFEELNPGEWIMSASRDYLVDKSPNLNDIVHGGFNKYHSHSVYMYTGSDTAPPCWQGVWKFIFEEPVKVSEAQLTEILKKSFSQVSSETNARRT